jgi:hypothetical protein
MHHAQRRLSPAFLIAIVALFVALAGTAAAAVIVNSPDDVAPGVINGTHLKDQSVSRFDLADPELRLRVDKDGDVPLGFADGTAKKVGTGRYEVTFQSAALNLRGQTTRTVLNHACAINATPHGALRQLFVEGPTPQRPNTVTVETAALRNFSGSSGFTSEDNAFDITATC